jgi:hypothetical protein
VQLLVEADRVLVQRRAARTISGVPLYEIRVHFEADREDDADRLIDAFAHAICAPPAEQNHRCPNRWNITTTELDPAEAAELDDSLNEQRANEAAPSLP